MNRMAVSILTVVAVLSGCGHDESGVYVPGEERPGGDSSVTVSGRNAFSMPSANMEISRRLDFSVGNSFFKNPWVAAPSSTTARDGLGPLFNTNGCQNCHIKDGRGHAPEDGDLNQVSMLIRISVPAATEEERLGLIKSGVVPHPVYGGQIQDFALPGGIPEGQVRVRYQYSDVHFADGEKVQLRKPVLEIENPGYGDLPDNLMMSARIAPPMIGLGLLEAIPEADLLALEDSEDRNEDGISGRLNRVWDVTKNKTVNGRFGWKAGQPDLRQQNAGAFNGDLGITSSLFMGENCTSAQQSCKDLMVGPHPEVSDKILDRVTFYSRNLAVPVRSKAKDAGVLKGKKLFYEAGCTGCHTPSFKTAKLEKQPGQSEQLIWPYTDLLLHDMGEGLADNRPEYIANGREWRTTPLWGIGKTFEVSKEAGFLHDGRARTLMEAILWHGGEAQDSRGRVLAMNKAQRRALLSFVGSL
ncbi:MAG: di-heme oxidoredictase family protein [Endozoicomonas sp.]